MGLCCHCRRQPPVTTGTSLWLYDATNRAVVWRRADPIVGTHRNRSYSAAYSGEAGLLSGRAYVESYVPIPGFGGSVTAGPVELSQLDYNSLPLYAEQDPIVTMSANASFFTAQGKVWLRDLGPYPGTKYGLTGTGQKTQKGWYSTGGSSGMGAAALACITYFDPDAAGANEWFVESPRFIAAQLRYETPIAPKFEAGGLTVWFLRTREEGGALTQSYYDLWNARFFPGLAETTDHDITRTWQIHVADAAGPGNETSCPWIHNNTVYHFKYESGTLHLKSYDAYTGDPVGDVECDIPAAINRGYHGGDAIWTRTPGGDTLCALRDDGSTISLFPIPSGDTATELLLTVAGSGGSRIMDFPWMQVCPNGDFLYWAQQSGGTWDLVRVDKDFGEERWRKSIPYTTAPGYTTCIGDDVYTNLMVSSSEHSATHLDIEGTVLWQSRPTTGSAQNFTLQAATQSFSAYILMAGHLPA